MARYDFSANVRLYLADGSEENHTIESYMVDVYSLEAAKSHLKTVVADIVGDWGSEKLDAPMDDFEIIAINYVRKHV